MNVHEPRVWNLRLIKIHMNPSEPCTDILRTLVKVDKITRVRSPKISLRGKSASIPAFCRSPLLVWIFFFLDILFGYINKTRLNHYISMYSTASVLASPVRVLYLFIHTRIYGILKTTCRFIYIYEWIMHFVIQKLPFGFCKTILNWTISLTDPWWRSFYVILPNTDLRPSLHNLRQ